MNTYTKKHLRDNIELSYTKDGDIEILISPGFGAGWSTWDNNSINLAVDKKIIDFFKEYGKCVSLDKLKTFLESGFAFTPPSCPRYSSNRSFPSSSLYHAITLPF